MDGVVDKCVTFAGGKTFAFLSLSLTPFLYNFFFARNRKVVSCERKLFIKFPRNALQHFFPSLDFSYLVPLNDWHTQHCNFCQLKLLVRPQVVIDFGIFFLRHHKSVKISSSDGIHCRDMAITSRQRFFLLFSFVDFSQPQKVFSFVMRC